MGNGDEIVAEHDTCTHLRTTANRIARGLREAKPTMAVSHNNIIDRRIACAVNPRANICTATPTSTPVRAINALGVGGQMASVRSLEAAQQRNADRNSRYRMAACEKIREQAGGI